MRIPTSAAGRMPALACAVLLTAVTSFAASDKTRPSVSVKANPSTGFAPTRVVVTAELKGGLDDFAEYYCPTIEWNWGDDTKAESKIDCDPYTNRAKAKSSDATYSIGSSSYLGTSGWNSG